MSATGTTTKARILDAAERLFAESGITTTSLRDITALAGVNIAAVNYHFGSRDALIEAVFRRRLEPINDARLARLGQLERRAAGKPLQLRDIIHAFIDPALAPSGTATPGAGPIVRLIAQIHVGHHARLDRFLHEQYASVLERFVNALSRALPELDPGELHWRLHFMIGATANTATDSFLMHLLADSADAEDSGDILSRLEAFLTAGFRAPSTSSRGMVERVTNASR